MKDSPLHKVPLTFASVSIAGGFSFFTNRLMRSRCYSPITNGMSPSVVGVNGACVDWLNARAFGLMPALI